VPGFSALILDLDGTVVDSHHFTFAAFRAACSPWREPPTDAQVFAAFGPSERVILQGLLEPGQVDAAYVRLQSYYAVHAGSVAIHPHMSRLLGDCRAARIRVGLFTGRGSDSTQMLLERLDLEWAFDAVRAGDTMRRPKPAPDGILQLLEDLASAANQTLVVGDSPLDLQAAAAAHVTGIFAAWHAWEGTNPPPDAPVATDPDDLRDWLELPHR
jgi:HAD superfamily hydrolase (TIGR01509 family)